MAGVQVFLQALFNRNLLVNLFGLPSEDALRLLGEHGVTHLSATPSFYRLLLPANTILPEVRAVTLGGERTDASLLERLRPLFPNARFRNVCLDRSRHAVQRRRRPVFRAGSPGRPHRDPRGAASSAPFVAGRVYDAWRGYPLPSDGRGPG
jgi:hypothetical protein